MNELIFVATLWNCDIILPNYEKEAETIPPIQVMNVLDEIILEGIWEGIWEGNVGWSMQGWLPNAVDYSPMTQRDQPVLLQIFPSDMRSNFPGDTRHDPEHVAKITGDCVAHARIDKGFQYVGVTWQTYGDMTPGDFDCTSFMHSTFPGNLISREAWKDWYIRS